MKGSAEACGCLDDRTVCREEEESKATLGRGEMVMRDILLFNDDDIIISLISDVFHIKHISAE